MKTTNMRQAEKMVSNILVVDDEKINIRLIENICKNEPLYKVIAAESGKQAIDIVGNQQIDLILLDIEMPDMDASRRWKRYAGSQMYRLYS